MNQRRAFTSAELIVVMCIGCMLAGLMFPTIVQERGQSRVLLCASNLKQIGIATFNYAADNHNYLPVWSEAHLSPLRHGAHAITAANYWDQDSFPNYAPPVAPPAGAPKESGANIFLLHIKGYLGKWNWKNLPPTIQRVSDAAADPSYFPLRFCPAQQDRLSTIASQWNASYFYNPHWIEVDPTYWANTIANNPSAANLGVTDPPMTIWYRKISDYPRNCVLATDMIVDPASVSHVSGGGKSAVWNLLYPDGHVAMITDSYVLSGLSGTGDAAKGGNQGPTGETVKEMQILDDYLDILETEADGKNPLKEAAVGAMISNLKTPLKEREVDFKSSKAVQRY